MKPREIIKLISSRLIEDIDSCNISVRDKDKVINKLVHTFKYTRCERQWLLDQIQNLFAPYSDDASLSPTGIGLKVCWNLLRADVDLELDVLTSLSNPEINPSLFSSALGNGILKEWQLLRKSKYGKSNKNLITA